MKVHVFDLRAEPVVLKPGRWSRYQRRDPAAMLGAALHQWDTPVGTMAANRLRYGEPLALAHRAREAPYTISCGVTSAGEGVVALAHPLERYTHASDAGNRSYVSIGVMGRFPFLARDHHPARHSAMSPGLRAAVELAMVTACKLIGEAKIAADPSIVDQRAEFKIITHRQCMNDRGDHEECPGEQILEAVLSSHLFDPEWGGAFVADPDLVLVPKYGKPWPEEWRLHMRPPAPPPQIALPLEVPALAAE